MPMISGHRCAAGSRISRPVVPRSFIAILRVSTRIWTSPSRVVMASSSVAMAHA